jgi:hypothetical protein
MLYLSPEMVGEAARTITQGACAARPAIEITVDRLPSDGSNALAASGG